MKQVDAELVRVLDAVSEAGNINLMVFSDHGMSARLGGRGDATSGLINVLDYVSSDDWVRAAGSKSAPALQIWPKPDNEDRVSQARREPQRGPGKHSCGVLLGRIFFDFFKCRILA